MPPSRSESGCRSREIWCAETAGNSPGSMTYFMRRGGAGDTGAGWLACSGDLMLDGATLHTWYDPEWDYGFCKGIHATATAAGYLGGHSWAIESPEPLIERYIAASEELQEAPRDLTQSLVSSSGATQPQATSGTAEKAGRSTVLNCTGSS